MLKIERMEECSITVHELKKKLSDNEDILLIDVREPYEHDAFNIGGKLIPFHAVFDNLEIISRTKPTVIYCRKGIRSSIIIQRLQERYNYKNLLNLTGGMDAWREQIGETSGS